MLCENCKKREANVRYSENINGIKKELHLCEECSQKLGITDEISFRMPTFDFSNFFGSFFEDLSTPDFIPLLNEVKKLKCDSCGFTFNDIVNTGRYGCANCYDTFENRMEPILKKLQDANMHNEKLGTILNNNIKFEKNSEAQRKEKIGNELEKLQENLKQAIKEERYEDAAKIRDEIKKILS